MSKPNKANQMPSVPFLIYGVSSEDQDYPSSELLSSSSSSRGWQTQRLVSFPQYLIIKFPRKVQLQSLQYLSHQCKISSKVEIHISLGGQKPAEPVFKKLGYFSLSSNESSNFQSRELKTVYVEAPVQFVKFVFMSPYPNNMNFFNQVGVIALTFYGSEISGNSERPPQNFAPSQKSDDLQTRMQNDQKTNDLIDSLENEKRKAVQNEDYAKAKEIKEQIQKLKDSADMIGQLEQRKRRLVEEEDFEAADIVKREIEKLMGLRNPKTGNNNREAKEDNNYEKKDNRTGTNEDQRRNDTKNANQKTSNSNPKEETNKRNNVPSRNHDRSGSNNEFPNEANNKHIDNMPGSGFNQNKKQQMDEFPNDQNENFGANEVAQKHLQKIEFLSVYFDQEFLEEVFSSSTQTRISGIERFVEETTNLIRNKPTASDTIFIGGNKAESILGCWKLNVYFLEERITQIVQNAFKVMEIILESLKNKKIALFLKNSAGFSSTVESILELVQDKVSDFKNSDIMDSCTNLVLEMNAAGFINSEDIVDKFTGSKPGVKGKAPMSFKHLTGRLILLQNFIREFGAELKTGHQKLVKYGVENLDNANKSVRDESIDLIVEIFKIIGENKVLKLLEASKIKKNHLENLQQRFEEEDENQGDENDEGDNAIEEENEAEEDEKPPKHENKVQSKAVVKKDDGPGECQFCGLADESFFNTDYLDMHLFKECQMLMTCHECHQVIEIRELNTHLLNECISCNNFRQCSRCYAAISNDLFKTHTSKMNCKLFRNDQKTLRCPLCFYDLIVKKPNHEEIWREHFKNSGCQKNARN